MDYTSHAVTFGGLRSAALFYDRLVPINVLELAAFPMRPIEEGYSPTDRVMDIYASHWEGLKSKQPIIKSLVFDDPNVSDSAVDNFIETLDEVVALAKYPFYRDDHTAFVNAGFMLPRFHPEQQAHLAINLINDVKLEDGSTFRAALDKLTGKLGLKQPAYLLPDFERTRKAGGKRPVHEVVFHCPDTVDYNRLSWEQIQEVRRDPRAHAALGMFRTFLYETYNEQSEAYIRDDVAVKMEAYRAACKKHGLLTKESWFSALSSNGDNARRLGLLLATQSIDGVALAAVIAEGLITAGRTWFEFKKVGFERDEFFRDNPLTYVDPSHFWNMEPGAPVLDEYSVEKAYEGFLDHPIITKPSFPSVVNPDRDISYFLPSQVFAPIQLGTLQEG